jgi:hypothetical protein
MTRAVALCLALSACAYDPGGSVVQRAAVLADGGQVEPITGECYSACTMRLAVACVAPDARLMIHGPRHPSRDLSPAAFDHYSRIMADHYAPPMADWFMVVGRHGEHWFTGADLIGRGWARGC